MTAKNGPHPAQLAVAHPVVVLFISWNCVGWQSLILLGLSFLVGLRCPMGWTSRLEVIVFGVLGTVLINLVRIATVCVLAEAAGYLPAVLFHDYGGNPAAGWLALYLLIHRLSLVAGEPRKFEPSRVVNQLVKRL